MVAATASGHLISYFQAIVIGLLQGVTELFPISSLGHAVILPKLFGWNLGQDKPYFLAFLVATHLATALVLFIFFLPEWVRILKGLGRSLRDREIAPGDADARLAWLLVVGTIPAGLIGLLFEHKLRSLFASPKAAAVFLAVNGLILFAAEYLRRRAPGAEERAQELQSRPEAEVGRDAEKRLATLGFREAVGVGTAQAAALFPGISRAGVTIGGGLFVGLTHEDAARYAFLLATPIIGAAALLKLPDLVGHQGDGVRGQALVGALCAGAAAWFAIKFLMRYFQTNTLTPFAVYCLVAGVAALLIFVL
ncbi:MAG: undecaprenyl-diphosphatase [Gaiellaceae bacterium]|nr:undecaprenyl-diphosphatase [Gaiellaceae bacterium]